MKVKCLMGMRRKDDLFKPQTHKPPLSAGLAAKFCRQEAKVRMLPAPELLQSKVVLYFQKLY